MKDKKRNPLILLICIIILLIFAIIILSLTSIPLMSSARENAFRIEANNVVKAAEKVYANYKDNNIVIPNDGISCSNEKNICVTIEKLSKYKYYVNNGYKGKVIIDITDINNPVYNLYLTKNAEFRVVGLNYTNYTEYGQINNESWNENYEICNCDTTD